jgi:hypothetical protein
VVEQDALLVPRAAGHLGHGQRRDVRVEHVEAGAVGGAGPAEVEAGVEPAGGGGRGSRGSPRECKTGFWARVRGRGRGFGAESGGGGGGGRCHLLSRFVMWQVRGCQSALCTRRRSRTC